VLTYLIIKNLTPGHDPMVVCLESGSYFFPLFSGFVIVVEEVVGIGIIILT
jgi:hypothetical protein